MRGDQKRDENPLPTFAVKVPQIEAVVFHLNASLAVVFPSTAFELNNQDEMFSQENCIDPLPAPRDWILQQQVQVARCKWFQGQSKYRDLLAPGIQLFRREFSESLVGHRGQTANYKVLIVGEKCGNWRLVVSRHDFPIYSNRACLNYRQSPFAGGSYIAPFALRAMRRVSATKSAPRGRAQKLRGRSHVLSEESRLPDRRWCGL